MASNFGFTENGFVMPTLEDVRSSVFSNAQSYLPELSFDENKLETAVVSFMANEIYCMWQGFYKIYNSNNPNFLTGCQLDIYGSRFGVSRIAGESDAAYRFRINSIQTGSGSLSGNSCFERLYSDLFSIADVQEVQVILNDSSEQLGVLPPNSYEVMVLGGNEQSIAQAIWNNHPAGITHTGNTAVQINDCTGVCRNVYFTRPKIVPIFIDIRVERISTNCGCTADTTDIVSDAIFEHINSEDGLCFTNIGRPVYAQDFFKPVYGIQGLGITCALISRDGLAADSSVVTLKRDEIPFFSRDCINIQFTPENITPCKTGFYLVPPAECQFGMDIVKTSTSSEFMQVGEIIEYSFEVTNTGVAPLTSDIIITDDKASVVCDSLPAGGLAVGDSMTCTALYEVTYEDAINGFVENKAQAVSGTIFSPCVSLTIPYTGPELVQSMSLKKELISGVCNQVGNILTYKYTITNTGTVPITGQPVINDNKITGVVQCPILPPEGLIPNGSISGTAQSVVTQQMLDDRECCNTARAMAQTPLSGTQGNVVSNSDTVCIECIPPNSSPIAPTNLSIVCTPPAANNPPIAPQDLTIDCGN